MSKRVMPAQKPGTSEQEVGTPPVFLAAVTQRFGRIAFDLAATRENAVVPDSFTPEDDSLKQPWAAQPHRGGWLWLNPPYADIDPWAEKCAAEMRLGARILLLTPASVGAEWFRKHVEPSAHVVELVGRVKFVGHKQGFPKDLVVSVFCAGLTGRSGWDWRKAWR